MFFFAFYSNFHCLYTDVIHKYYIPDKLIHQCVKKVFYVLVNF